MCSNQTNLCLLSLHTSTHGGSSFFSWFLFVALCSPNLIPTELTFQRARQEIVFHVCCYHWLQIFRSSLECLLVCGIWTRKEHTHKLTSESGPKAAQLAPIKGTFCALKAFLSWVDNLQNIHHVLYKTPAWQSSHLLSLYVRQMEKSEEIKANIAFVRGNTALHVSLPCISNGLLQLESIIQGGGKNRGATLGGNLAN